MDDIGRARFPTSNYGQLTIFKARELCHQIGLNWMAALHLYDQGLLSFNPSTERNLLESQMAELKLVGSLVVAGCDDLMLRHLLRGLTKPYQYRQDMIYYDWASQEWRLLPLPEDIDRSQFFQEWLDELVDQGELDELKALEASVRTALETATENSESSLNEEP
jgi:hypothetical protein